VFSSLAFSLSSSFDFSGDDQTCSNERSSVILAISLFLRVISKITS